MKNEFEIFHINREGFYDYVATIGGDNIDLDDVWRLGNSINSAWWENEEVSEKNPSVFAKGGARSLMVGDRIRNITNEDDFTPVYEVADCGFDEIHFDPETGESINAREYAELENYAGTH